MSGGGLTVAVATLNRPEGLARCLEALLGGEELPDEIVVVDQGDASATRRVLERVHGARPPVVHVPQERRGLSASRNAAVRRSSGSILAFTDDDCVPERGWVAALRRAFQDAEAAAVSGRVLALGEPTPGTWAVSLRTDAERRSFRGPQAPWVVGTGGNFAARRTWLERVGPFDERLGAGTRGRAAEDMDLIYRLLRSGATILYEPEAVIYHERQPLERRLSSRFDYGHGMAAFCGAWLVRGDARALSILWAWTRQRLRSLASATRARDGERVRQQLLNLRGAAAGLLYGLRNPALPLTTAASRPRTDEPASLPARPGRT